MTSAQGSQAFGDPQQRLPDRPIQGQAICSLGFKDENQVAGPGKWAVGLRFNPHVDDSLLNSGDSPHGRHRHPA
jgi:hypothetical protein